jgi:pimeloyl-ACP methyl ester carboxylesterase
MARRQLLDGDQSFDVTVLEPLGAGHVVLFGVGRGGNPDRHLPLLEALADRGCVVLAPHFERLSSAFPSDEDLLLRARRLRLALDAWGPRDVPVAGVGHSLGATMLVALAGAELWTVERQRVPVARLERVDRLVLMTPPTGFFRAPGALDEVSVPILAWAGTNDLIVTPEQVQFLARALSPRVPVEVRLVEGAGHFSFMNEPPPQTTDTLPDREAFLSELAEQIGRFVVS